MPYRLKLIKTKGSNNNKKEIDITFPVKGAELAKIFPRSKIFSSDKLAKALLEALECSIKEIVATWEYDETRIQKVGTHLVKLLNTELAYLGDIKNYENHYQVLWSTEEFDN